MAEEIKSLCALCMLSGVLETVLKESRYWGIVRLVLVLSIMLEFLSIAADII